jgi:hypothetical protein
MSRFYRPYVAVQFFGLLFVTVVWNVGWAVLLLLVSREGSLQAVFAGLTIFCIAGDVCCMSLVALAVREWRRCCGVDSGLPVGNVMREPVCAPTMIPQMAWLHEWKRDDRGGVFYPDVRRIRRQLIVLFSMLSVAFCLMDLVVWTLAVNRVLTMNIKIVMSVMLVGVGAFVGMALWLFYRAQVRSVITCRVDGDRCIIKDGTSTNALPLSSIVAVQFCLWLRKEISLPTSGQHTVSWTWCLETNVVWRSPTRCSEDGHLGLGPLSQVCDGTNRRDESGGVQDSYQRRTVALVSGDFCRAIPAVRAFAAALGVPVVNNATKEEYMSERINGAKRIGVLPTKIGGTIGQSSHSAAAGVPCP